ncbi:hypothetical protein I552_10139 [Mycobacterium xenopi 3993]|nr:hypothetical protein I552_10139 [Mycobacterium xenopi 3993]
MRSTRTGRTRLGDPTLDRAWPLVINDQTEEESSTPPRELVLRAGLGPFGAAQIMTRLHDVRDGCRVEMIEVRAPRPVPGHVT